MNRLQKKCVIATAGVHLLLVVILFVGPAFFYSKPKADDIQVLDVIPANLIDAQFNSGVANANPPPPTPVAPPQPPPPTPVVTPPTPAPAPEKTEPVKPPDKLPPDDLNPVEKKPAKSSERKIQINTQLVARVSPRDTAAAAAQAEAREQQRQAQAIRSALRNLKINLAPGTTIDMPGNSSVAYANYGTVIVSVYRHAWVPPDGMANDSAMVKFTVFIASDGTVISARITEPSGDANVDAAVQHMLERVTFIAPFPEGATEKERSYTMNFNATRRTLE